MAAPSSNGELLLLMPHTAVDDVKQGEPSPYGFLAAAARNFELPLLPLAFHGGPINGCDKVAEAETIDLKNLLAAPRNYGELFLLKHHTALGGDKQGKPSPDVFLAAAMKKIELFAFQGGLVIGHPLLLLAASQGGGNADIPQGSPNADHGGPNTAINHVGGDDDDWDFEEDFPPMNNSDGDDSGSDISIVSSGSPEYVRFYICKNCHEQEVQKITKISEVYKVAEQGAETIDLINVYHEHWHGIDNTVVCSECQTTLGSFENHVPRGDLEESLIFRMTLLKMLYYDSSTGFVGPAHNAVVDDNLIGKQDEMEAGGTYNNDSSDEPLALDDSSDGGSSGQED